MRLQERNLRLNFENLFGHFSEKDVSLDKSKICAIDEAASPSTPDEVSSFLGMVTFCSRFIQNAATIAEPLRKLTHKKTAWNWSDAEQHAFQELKDRLKKGITLSFYDVKKPTKLIVDASPAGLGAILAQESEKR